MNCRSIKSYKLNDDIFKKSWYFEGIQKYGGQVNKNYENTVYL